MKNLAKEISSYIKYLKRRCNLQVSLHFKQSVKNILLNSPCSEIVEYNYHSNPYCLNIKTDEKMYKKCLICQRAVIYKCNKEDFFIGVCYADVKEYIFALKKDGEAFGFISVSGFKADKERMEKTDEQKVFYKKYLKREMTDEKYCKTLIMPLCRMIELLFTTYISTIENYDSGYTAILDYLSENHTDVSLEKMSAFLNYSPSYISHTFKKNNGNTIKKYCNILKIADAKSFLRTTDKPISEIAYMSGFNDLSYFINTFRTITGTTPLNWRKSHRN